MIRIGFSEQQLFDMIMAVYAAGNAEGADQDPDTVKRREALLNKLHRHFDNKVMASEIDQVEARPHGKRRAEMAGHAVATHS